MKSKKAALLIGYLTVGVQSLSSIVLTRLYLKYLGFEIYGIYQMVFSIAQYILLFDFGIATTLVKYRIEYLEKSDKQGDENLLAHYLLIILGLSIIVVTIGAVVCANMGNIYSSLSDADVLLAQKLLIFMLFQIVFTFIDHFFQGIALSSENYTIVKMIVFVMMFAKFIFAALLLVCNLGIVAVVCSDTIITLGCCLVLGIYTYVNSPFKIRLHYWNSKLIKSVAILMGTLMLQTLATYVNSAATKTIVGIMLNPYAVTVFSIAITMQSFFTSIPNSMQSLYATQATQLVVHNASGEELTDMVIRPGRIAFMFCGAVIAGFTLFGKNFICLWVGKEALDAWALTLWLIIPRLFTLIQNTAIHILTAKNKRLFGSMVAVITSLMNIILTIYLIKIGGIKFAAIGTAVSLIIGNIIVSNIYYKKIIHLNVLRMYKDIFSKIWLCIVVASVISIFAKSIDISPLINFIICCSVFCIAYAIMLWIYGMNINEKAVLKNMLKRH